MTRMSSSYPGNPQQGWQLSQPGQPSASNPLGYGQQPYPGTGAQPAPQQAGGAQLLLHLKPAPGFLAKAMTTPKVTIDNYPVPVQWGDVAIPVAPGMHRLTVRVGYLFDFGQAILDVAPQPGQTVEVFYATPAITFMGGAIGHAPQKTPAMVFVWISWGILAATLIFMVVIFALVFTQMGS